MNIPMQKALLPALISGTLMITAALGFLGYYIGGDVWVLVEDTVARRVSGTPELGQMLATSWVRADEPWAMIAVGSVIFVAVLGFNMLKATAHTKVVNFTSNFSSFLFFAVAGHVLWLPAIVMAAGQLAGARMGAGLAMKHGASVIKPLLVVVSIVITAKLVYDDPENVIHVWVMGLLT